VMFKHDCKIHGHRFEPRYSEEPSGYTFSGMRGVSASALRDLLVVKRYIHDVCVKCGQIAEKVGE